MPTRRVPAHWLLVDGVPPGRYSFAALFRHAGQALEITTGEGVLHPQHAGFRWHAYLLIRGDATFHAIGWIRNDGDEALPVEVQHCALRLYAYRDPDLSGPPVWQWTPQTGGERRCPTPGAERRTLAPGDSIASDRLWAGIPVSRLLGDSLPRRTVLLCGPDALQLLRYGTLFHRSRGTASSRGAGYAEAQPPFPDVRKQFYGP